MRTLCGSSTLLVSCVLAAQSVPGWHLLPTQHRPPGRWSFDMAYDAARAQVVMFGGGTTGGDDTWVFDGSDWRELQPAIVPPWRSMHSMAYDAVRDRVVVFGGVGAAGWLADTWEWDGAAWLRRASASTPPARALAAMAFDPLRGRTLLFGGQAGGVQGFGDTWEWDGVDWILRSPARAPAARLSHGMVWDAVRQRVLLHGGGYLVPFDDTWEWDGNDWTERAPVHTPGLTYGRALAFDAARGVGVLTGTRTSTAVANETWEWDGADWTLANALPVLPAIAGHRIVYDAARGRTLLFGGTREGVVAMDETWILHVPPAGAAAYTPFGRGCAGSAGLPELLPRSLPWLGQTLDLEVRNIPRAAPCLVMCGFSTTAHWVLPLPAELSSFWMPGCTLYTDVVEWCLAAPVGDVAQVGVFVPSLPQLAGTAFYQQALVHDPAANARGYTTSNAGAATLGMPVR